MNVLSDLQNPLNNASSSDELDHLIAHSKLKLERLEKLRLLKIHSYEWRRKFALIIAPIVTPILGYIDYWLYMLQRASDDQVVGLTLLFLGGLWYWVNEPKRQYTREYKKRILPDLAKLFGNFIYDLKGKIPMRRMKPSKIIPDHSKYKAEDHFKGVYKGIDIEFSEVKLTKTKGSGKNRRTVTVFKGLAVLLNLNHKKFYGHTILERNTGTVNEWFKEKNLDLKRANLVDPEFEGIFDVYTNDQVEARYIVDPKMMESLKDVYQKYHGKKMTAAFYQKNMLMLISSDHNHFEPDDLYVPAASLSNLLVMKNEIEKVLSVVDRLSLCDPESVHKGS